MKAFKGNNDFLLVVITVSLLIVCCRCLREKGGDDDDEHDVLALTSDRFTKRNGLNVPGDYYSIRDGLALYPPRTSVPDPDYFNQTDGCGYSKKISLQLLSSIEKAVMNFYARTAGVKKMRADSGYGLRLLGGQLNHVISKMSHSKELRHLQRYFIGLAEKSMALGEAVMNYSIADDQMDKSIQRGIKLMLEKETLLHPKNFTWQSAEKIAGSFREFDETKIGDELEVNYPYLDFHCRVALVSGCEVPLVCRKMYLEDIYSQYMLTHQFLYLQYANKAGCVEQNKEIFKDAELRMDKLCSKMYLEAEFLEKNGFPTRYIDLFAEQVGFCGLAGYPNFLREDWLREILSWQSKSDSGCFIDHYKNARMTDAVVTIQSKMPSGEVIEEDCLTHLTAVGVMALAVNLRRIVDTCPEDYFREYEPRYWTP